MSAVLITCPPPLRDIPAFLVWKFEPNEGGGKPRKVPYYVGGGRRWGGQGTPRDLARLTTFDQALAFAAKGFDGVGFAPLPQFNIVALDFDNCVTDGQVHPDLAPVVMSTYAELSPSGRGIRAFYQGSLPDRKSHDGPYGFEIFSSKGYVTLTGRVLDAVELEGNQDTVAPIPPDVMAMIEARFKREPGTASSSSGERMGLTEDEIQAVLDLLPNDLDYDSYVQTGMAVHHETNGEGFELWDAWCQRSPKYTTREYNWERWVSFGKNDSVFGMHGLRKMAGLSSTLPAHRDEFVDSTPELLAAEQAIEDAKPLRYEIQNADVFTSGPAPSWLIKGILPQADLIVLYGASGSGKSFMALDMAMSLARGEAWRKKYKTRQTNVVYIAAEGSGGFKKRVQAYGQHNALDLATLGQTFGVLASAPNLLEKTDCQDLVNAIKARGNVGLVIIDTLAQTTPGANENAGEDMGLALKHCKRIKEVTGATVLLVHHAGKDAAKGARGWSGLKAAADAELEVSREATARALRVSKQKDGEDNLIWGFSLETVNLGCDEDMEPITSCVVLEADVPARGGVPGRALGVVETVVNAVIQEFAQAQTEGIEVGPVIAESVKRMEAPVDGKRDTRRMRVRKALESLCNGDDAPYWLGDDGCISVT